VEQRLASGRRLTYHGNLVDALTRGQIPLPFRDQFGVQNRKFGERFLVGATIFGQWQPDQRDVRIGPTISGYSGLEIPLNAIKRSGFARHDVCDACESLRGRPTTHDDALINGQLDQEELLYVLQSF
jgi:hypothetical protein